jgi:Ribbon-helix-helix protein, copG family
MHWCSSLRLWTGGSASICSSVSDAKRATILSVSVIGMVPLYVCGAVRVQYGTRLLVRREVQRSYTLRMAKNAKKTEPVTVRLDQDVRERLDTVASELERSLSWTINRALREWLDSRDNKKQ